MTDKPGLDVIFWDLGNVLVELDFVQLFDALCPLLQTSREKLHKDLFATGLFDQVNRGHISPQRFHLQLREHLELSEEDVPYEAFVAAWTTFFLPRPAMGTLLQELQGKVPQWLLSNTDPLHHQRCQQDYSYLEHLDGHLTSYQLRAMKPEPSIYERALQYIGASASRALFFDDKDENIQAARDAGLHAHLYQSPEHCRSIIAEFQLLL